VETVYDAKRLSQPLRKIDHRAFYFCCGDVVFMIDMRNLFYVYSAMILEIAQLKIRPGQTVEFENAFKRAQTIIASMPGYISHELRRCIESKEHYVLLVRWQSLEAHEHGFRQSPEYQEWKRMLHHFYNPFPTVLHYEVVPGI
jgi:heme-degrading monooxygenase HmoA